MAYNIVINKRFISRLTEVLIFLEQEWGKKVADDFIVKIDTRIYSLQHHPFIGAMTRHQGIRGILSPGITVCIIK